MSEQIWQILDVGSIWMREFASALAEIVPTVAWIPDMRRFGAAESYERLEAVSDPRLDMLHFPLQRGYSRPVIRNLLRFERSLLKKLGARCADPTHSPLICSTPFYAPVAELWPGPVIYYVTDRTADYAGLNGNQVRALDRRLCALASAVCPNSERLAAYLRDSAGCDPDKLQVVPNATRASNIAPAPLLAPEALPADIAHLPRPVFGVIGNLAANMDWPLLAETIPRSGPASWVFVGPTSMPVPDPAQARARRWVMAHAHFTGGKPYGELQRYARCFDVAVLPYVCKEPTYSGSSTRFYEHLAACRPMVATRGFAELLQKSPLLDLVDTPGDMAASLHRLRALGFCDGYEALRWQASIDGTWQVRARTLVDSLSRRKAAGMAADPAPAPVARSADAARSL